MKTLSFVIKHKLFFILFLVFIIFTTQVENCFSNTESNSPNNSEYKNLKDKSINSETKEIDDNDNLASGAILIVGLSVIYILGIHFRKRLNKEQEELNS